MRREEDPQLSRVSPVLRALEKTAQRERVVVDASFVRELQNYSLHRRVRRLGDEHLAVVIEGIGKRALAAASGQVGGGHVRETIMILCPDVFGSCDQAARKVLVDAKAPNLSAALATLGPVASGRGDL